MFLLCTDQKGPKQDRQLEGLIELEEVSLMLPCGKKLPVLHCNKIFQVFSLKLAIYLVHQEAATKMDMIKKMRLRSRLNGYF